MPTFGLGEAPGEFIEIAGADQLAMGGVIAWWQCPVAAGGVAAPDPPPRVLAPEPVEPAVPVGRVPAAGHPCCPPIAAVVSLYLVQVARGWMNSGLNLTATISIRHRRACG